MSNFMVKMRVIGYVLGWSVVYVNMKMNICVTR